MDEIEEKEGHGVLRKVVEGGKDVGDIQAWYREISRFIDTFMVSLDCLLRYVLHSLRLGRCCDGYGGHCRGNFGCKFRLG